MCGIAGYIGLRDMNQSSLQTCLALMKRRGPDSSGMVNFRTRSGKKVFLLHSRLSIIDRDERANQPFCCASDYLVFNGEIYNFIEIRKKLRAASQAFTTNSDTEVLARQLNTYGLNGLNDCEGMWAFAWFDATSHTLILSRDRFGEKPLYLYKSKDGLYFGSEAKYIFCLLGHTLPINSKQLFRYLVNGYKSLYKTNDTFYEGLIEVRPGHCVLVDDAGSTKQQPYWEPEFNSSDESITYQDAVQNTRESLIRSVKLRLRSDVPVAFCLSGGIDSNALASIAKCNLNYNVHGFTIMNTDSRYEERDTVNAAVKQLDIKHTAIPVDTSDFLPNLKTLVQQHDAPVYTITYYAQWRMMQAIASEGYKVSISGTGADELFSGYYDHHNAYLYDMRSNASAYQQALNNWNHIIAPIVRNPLLQDPECFIKNPAQREHIYLDAHCFADYLTHDWWEDFTEYRYCNDLLRNRMANELFHESVPPILHEDDLNAMFYSVENRSPFLDRQLFDFCQRIPTRHLIKNGIAKSVLRDAVRGLTPDTVLDNPRKVGFNAPIYDYLDVNHKPMRDYLLDNSLIFEYIQKNKIEALINKSQLPNSESKFLFYFLNSKIFLETIAESKS